MGNIFVACKICRFVIDNMMSTKLFLKLLKLIMFPQQYEWRKQ